MIYFIQDTRTFAIKIGFTDGEAESRLAALQTGNPHELRLLATTDGDRAFEAELHRKFKASQLVGEWFQPTTALIDFIIVTVAADGFAAGYHRGTSDQRAADRTDGPTLYAGTAFDSRLEAQWAAFFELAGWNWEYKPEGPAGWYPTFAVDFHCGHSECVSYHEVDGRLVPLGRETARHSLLVAVEAFASLGDFPADHPGRRYPYGNNSERDGEGIPYSASAIFGDNPDVTEWEMGHGAGGGVEEVTRWLDDAWGLWEQAGELLTTLDGRVGV